MSSSVAGDSILTIRLIKSFEFRNIKLMVLRNLDLATMTGADLKKRIGEEMASSSSYKIYRSCQFDSLQIYSVPQQCKPNALVVDTSSTYATLIDDNRCLSEQLIGMPLEEKMSMCEN
jgi:Uncharacterized conserved protein (DUF2340)